MGISRHYFDRLGKLVAKRRAALRLSLREAARRSGTSYQLVYDVEYGTASLESAIVVSTALGVPTRSIVDIVRKMVSDSRCSTVA